MIETGEATPAQTPTVALEIGGYANLAKAREELRATLMRLAEDVAALPATSDALEYMIGAIIATVVTRMPVHAVVIPERLANEFGGAKLTQEDYDAHAWEIVKESQYEEHIEQEFDDHFLCVRVRRGNAYGSIDLHFVGGLYYEAGDVFPPVPGSDATEAA